MSQGANAFFNVVSVMFLVLTLVVGVITLRVASGNMDAPVFAPDEDAPLPTQIVLPTLTPSVTPAGFEAPAVTPVETPVPTAAQ